MSAQPVIEFHEDTTVTVHVGGQCATCDGAMTPGGRLGQVAEFSTGSCTQHALSLSMWAHRGIRFRLRQARTTDRLVALAGAVLDALRLNPERIVEALTAVTQDLTGWNVTVTASTSTVEQQVLRATLWAAAGWSADDSTAWAITGIEDPQIATAWRQSGFDAESAAVWAGSGLGPSEAAPWHRAGATVTDMRICGTLQQWLFLREANIPASAEWAALAASMHPTFARVGYLQGHTPETTLRLAVALDGQRLPSEDAPDWRICAGSVVRWVWPAEQALALSAFAVTLATCDWDVVADRIDAGASWTEARAVAGRRSPLTMQGESKMAA